ncbi:nuclear transport factor 2 family protein [Streptomyces zagrosensis]|uniref:SnoaL-like domain-containing protein n=1 Tax=Streptomyces zagrosensis TaxID=1042984 RepID=A0A7W9V115_9ACTN|nr:nuclear transport factor 2 family protein [Streptomyces zagrosensis]MBB5938462.1 hypothetical protein [Streptomyces zagrosensis]
MTIPRTPSSIATLTAMYAAEAAYLAAGTAGTAEKSRPADGAALAAPDASAPFRAFLAFFSPDVVLHQADALPYGGTWRGHQGIAGNMRAMAKAWERFDFVEQEFLATGETAVVRTQVRARARATGRELAFPILQTVTVHDGRITEVRPFYWDTQAIADACTPVPTRVGQPRP